MNRHSVYGPTNTPRQEPRERRRLVHAFAATVALGARAVVVVAVELVADDASQDLAAGRQRTRRDKLRRIPQLRAHERLRALRVRGFDVDEDAELRRLAVDRARREQRGIGDERRAAVDAKRLADAGDHEQDADARINEDVAQRIGEPVAGPIGDEQRAIVEDAHEARWIAARADVARAVAIARRDARERRELDESTRVWCEVIDDLRPRG